MKYCLAVESVHEINHRQVAQTNEPFGLRNESGLLSALAHPLTVAGGRFAFPTPVARTAALFESLLDAHPYLQGNKRTA
ncbi:MAG TPA: Fic family protein, partial [Beutenbergiaceae bacterium]|nr:Fic family protein [Beutenbergiaceae bacterium]